MSPTALIAEDEPLLAAALKTELRAAWPGLQIVACVGDGASAVREALTLQPPTPLDQNQPAQPIKMLRVIQASVGSSIRMLPLDDVLYFEAADKYVRVLTATHEFLIRTPLKELLPQLDAHSFWQVHRGTVARASSIEAVTRDEAVKLWLGLRGCAQKLPVSRLYAHLFKAM